MLQKATAPVQHELEEEVGAGMRRLAKADDGYVLPIQETVC